MKTLLVGYGNELRGDDGAGWVLADLSRHLGVDVLCCHQLLPDLAASISEFDRVIFADATTRSGGVHLDLVCAECPAEALVSGDLMAWSAHQGLPQQVLSLCKTLYGQAPEGWWLTLPGEEFGQGQGLSAKARSSVEEGLKRIRELVVPALDAT